MGSRNLPQLRGNASSNPNHPRSTILQEPKIFCRSISRRPPFRSSPDPPTRPTSWWTFRVGRRGLGDELRVLPQFGHARQVPSVRRSPPLPPRLARCDPPLSAASLRCSRALPALWARGGRAEPPSRGAWGDRVAVGNRKTQSQDSARLAVGSSDRWPWMFKTYITPTSTRTNHPPSGS